MKELLVKRKSYPFAPNVVIAVLSKQD